nr:sialate O-acetylesterase [Allomuricauda sp.]
MGKRLNKIQLLAIMMAFSSASLWAEVSLPSVFANNMVLQQNAKAKFWGNADPHENISVFASWGEELKVVANAQGKWSAALPTPSGSHTPHQIIFKGTNTVFLRNVLIGEVWLCSGQSNMGFSLKQANFSYEEVKRANYSSIRFFKIPQTMAWEPQNNVNAKWEMCTSETAANQSAVAYFFGRKLLQELDVPIGLIISAWGGSDAQAWIDKKTAAEEGHQDIVTWFNTNEQELKNRRFKWNKEVAEWRAQQPEGTVDYSTRPPKNKLPGDNHIPFGLYNGMINPIKTFTMKGAIWYQGESNVRRANQYRTLFPAMIKSWRNVWNQGDFPFYFVQLAPFHYDDFHGVLSAELRDAQLKTLDKVKHTGMVVTTDIGNSRDIHPRRKQEVGYRLALLALKDYGKLNQGYSSPLYKSSTVKGNSIIIDFEHAEGLRMVRGREILGLTIAGKNKEFVRAKGEIINGNQLKVWSEKVKRPVAVRYGWSNAPFLNLFNGERLPVSPFKTDDWEDTTKGKIYLDFP